MTPQTAGRARDVLLAYANGRHDHYCDGHALIDGKCSCGLVELVEQAEAEARAAARRVLLDHEPGAEWGYQWMFCTCGWKDADAIGLRAVDPDSKTWLEHILRAYDAALAVPSDAPEKP